MHIRSVAMMKDCAKILALISLPTKNFISFVPALSMNAANSLLFILRLFTPYLFSNTLSSISQRITKKMEKANDKKHMHCHRVINKFDIIGFAAA